MTNMKLDRKGAMLTITVDLSKISHKTAPKLNKFGKSYPGSVGIATSHGNTDIGDGVRLGLNIFKARPVGDVDEADDTDDITITK